MSYLLTELQKKVVEHKNGPLLILAKPGTGKTFLLAQRIKKLLTDEQGNHHILVLTYTKVASESLKSRLSHELSEMEGWEQRVYIGTLLKFGLDMLRARGDLIGLQSNHMVLMDEYERNDVLRRVVYSLPDMDRSSFHPEKSRETLDFIRGRKRQLTPPIEIPLIQIDSPELEENELLYREYDRYLRQHGLLDMDDLIYLPYRIIKERESLGELYRKQYTYVCMDDGQDLDFASYQLIRALYPDTKSNIMIMGDPDQAIFSFMGGDGSCLSSFQRDYEPTVIELDKSYRLHEDIVKYARKLVPELELEPNFIGKEGSVDVKGFETQEAEAAWVADNLKEIQKLGIKGLENPPAWNQMAVIARSRHTLRKVEVALRQRGIPYNNGTLGYLESESRFIQLFELGIRIMTSSSNRINMEQMLNFLQVKRKPESILNTNRGIDALHAMKNLINGQTGSSNYDVLLKVWDFLSMNPSSFPDALEKLRFYMEDELEGNWESHGEGYIIQDDLAMWSDYWKQYMNTKPIRPSLSQFRTNLPGLTRKNNTSGVNLLTVHLAKGLEFDIVHIIELNQGTLPFQHMELSEERKILYVAMTRAKRMLYLSYCESKGTGARKRNLRPSVFLEEMGLLTERT
ncbi:ATP-dependent helicase [Paenibacillus sp. Soil750]|uniref:ATP-dependent helicase n=1 Tax=Paenibacillus sp. Soil750 TaxID=1736398 RepID=UPI0006F99E4C|nr:ATP-dependent helicase [Paenibacillus sp. Soil750]KRE73926.1 hypothetical protein ASL11_06300 [Paenibacillus sp. Soil750]